MKVFYWAPFLSNIATVDAVIKSINSINNYDKHKIFKPFIIDSTGEWSSKEKKTNNINFIKLYNRKFYKYLPKGGYFKSRISQGLIFFLSFFKLKKLITKENPNFLIAHLIISLPLLLFSIFNFKTKLIIRISGTPKFNYVRKFFWKILSKKVYKVTCPTISTYKILKKLEIFSEDKLEILYDPVISVREINKKKFEPIEKRFQNSKFILGIGRLTKQKNFELLIRAFLKVKNHLPDHELIILGEGEQRSDLEKLIYSQQLEEKIYLLGHKSNVFSYLKKATCFISSSLYEDPGFALIEAGFLNKIVFAADSNTGPSEILNMSERGILFKNKNHDDLAQKIIDFSSLEKNEIKSKIFRLKYYSKNFTLFSHFKKLNQILIS
jgi:glycosyltransferase involved in cell wall biosynthesis